ncbi:hypothetical protein COT52_01015 [candidate division WWE3 bacterium CG08_land_8_20_14_0_20_43_13]|uniref:Uncharacterized protein n=2 Tax=Bacteria candidate phyla TaxID=1783234 RepID=A0A2H0X7T9_UNCKA|nr:MAG: hypothetical protein COT52_01015 [candidate division WWE3 bacterium CG08_land_8_20_14_0_20_43_13]PJE73246.1 MAG: hypothetical protein COV00_00900 [Candidatus Tagabacteria bacterium CG10_big_fil_rev_8_21_14_0_10_40_13]
MEYSFFWTVIPFIIGVLAIFIYSQIAARKELKLREKGYKPTEYQYKLPREYTKKQKKFTLLIALFLLFTASLAFYLLLNKQLLLANFVIILGIVVWRILIRIGNSIK